MDGIFVVFFQEEFVKFVNEVVFVVKGVNKQIPFVLFVSLEYG